MSSASKVVVFVVLMYFPTSYLEITASGALALLARRKGPAIRWKVSAQPPPQFPFLKTIALDNSQICATGLFCLFIMGLDNLMLKLDEIVTGIIGEWDIYTTTITIILVTFFAYQVFTTRDPDAHPMLLARQAQASPVRQPGESAVFRSHSAPHGIPLNSGLNIKDPGDSKWARGKDGDLRDVWRRVLSGALDRDGKETGEVGSIMTVLGTENIIKHGLGMYYLPQLLDMFSDFCS